MEDDPQSRVRQERILAAYAAARQPDKKKDEPITTLEELLEKAPSIKKARAYYKSVLENITDAESESFLK